MKPLKITALIDLSEAAPANQDFTEDLKSKDWQTEANVINALKRLGHHVRTIGIFDSLNPFLESIQKEKPDIVFNLVESFRNDVRLDRNIPALLELLNIPYTGTNPTGLTLCRNKATSKQLLMHSHIRTPKFIVLKKKKKLSKLRQLKYPLFVKPLRVDGSVGISQASYVETDEELKERVTFVHKKLERDAIVEEYIEGRELYVSILGNNRLRVLPIREIYFGQIPEEEPKLATFKAKWDPKYRKRWGIFNRFATGLAPEVEKKIKRICKRAYRHLNIQGYGRIDLRLTAENKTFILEANPNPFIAREEDFAESAKKAGLSYEELIQKIVNLGLAKS